MQPDHTVVMVVCSIQEQHSLFQFNRHGAEVLHCNYREIWPILPVTQLLYPIHSMKQKAINDTLKVLLIRIIKSLEKWLSTEFKILVVFMNLDTPHYIM